MSDEPMWQTTTTYGPSFLFLTDLDGHLCLVNTQDISAIYHHFYHSPEAIAEARTGREIKEEPMHGAQIQLRSHANVCDEHLVRVQQSVEDIVAIMQRDLSAPAPG